MKKIIALAAGAVLALGIMSPAQADPNAGLWRVNENQVDTVGTVKFLDDGVFVRTTAESPEAGGTFPIGRNFRDMFYDNPTLSQDWSGTAEPGMRLELDLGYTSEPGHPDGKVDATLVYESVYNGNLWLTPDSAQMAKDLAPHEAQGEGNNDGQGSKWYGTLAEWRDAVTAGTRLVRGGFVLGLPGRGTLDSQTYGDATYRFAPAPAARPDVWASSNTWFRHARVHIHALQPSGTVPTPKGAFYRVQKVNPKTGRVRTVATGRVNEDNSAHVKLRWRGFKNSPKFKKVRVVSYGKVISTKRVRVRW